MHHRGIISVKLVRKITNFDLLDDVRLITVSLFFLLISEFIEDEFMCVCAMSNSLIGSLANFAVPSAGYRARSLSFIMLRD